MRPQSSQRLDAPAQTGARPLQPDSRLHVLNQIQENEGHRDVGRDSNEVRWEASIELQGALFRQRLHGTVQRTLIGECTIRVGRHLLHARFYEIERKAAGT